MKIIKAVLLIVPLLAFIPGQTIRVYRVCFLETGQEVVLYPESKFERNNWSPMGLVVYTGTYSETTDSLVLHVDHMKAPPFLLFPPRVEVDTNITFFYELTEDSAITEIRTLTGVFSQDLIETIRVLQFPKLKRVP